MQVAPIPKSQWCRWTDFSNGLWLHCEASLS